MCCLFSDCLWAGESQRRVSQHYRGLRFYIDYIYICPQGNRFLISVKSHKYNKSRVNRSLRGIHPRFLLLLRREYGNITPT